MSDQEITIIKRSVYASLRAYVELHCPLLWDKKFALDYGKYRSGTVLMESWRIIIFVGRKDHYKLIPDALPEDGVLDHEAYLFREMFKFFDETNQKLLPEKLTVQLGNLL